MSTRWDPRGWNFDIDQFLNPFVPPPPWSYLPYPVSRFFGYRKSPTQSPGNLVAIFWAFIGIFCGISIITVVSEHIPSFKDAGAPLIVGSFVSLTATQIARQEGRHCCSRNDHLRAWR